MIDTDVCSLLDDILASDRIELPQQARPVILHDCSNCAADDFMTIDPRPGDLGLYFDSVFRAVPQQ